MGCGHCLSVCPLCMKHDLQEQNTNGGVVMNNAEINIENVTYEIHRHYSGNRTVQDLIRESLLLEEVPHPVFDKKAHEGV